MTDLNEHKKRSYFKRFQTKFRRRRECKTNYRRRAKLIIQKKNLYDTPKYRLVVRIAGKQIVAQCVYSKISGDVVVASARSSELKNYGITFGLTNYAASYCVGLLCARRAIKEFGAKVEVFAPKNDDDARKECPEVVLDVGLRTTTLGARVFSIMRGAFDGGLRIPHGDKKLFGYNMENKMLDAEEFRNRILGKSVSEYMTKLNEETPEKYKVQFSQYIAKGITPDSLEKLYTDAHEKISKDCEPTPKKVRTEEQRKAGKKYKKVKMTLAEKKERIEKKKEVFSEKYGISA
eukprot:GHVP01005297.1.p1 GENE.GHVP01005297.1~~GHVP01005297.1.p1  ORF type:complete len:291 (-),score=70.89 GHVP01005297.1:735-1607(-)